VYTDNSVRSQTRRMELRGSCGRINRQYIVLVQLCVNVEMQQLTDKDGQKCDSVDGSRASSYSQQNCTRIWALIVGLNMHSFLFFLFILGNCIKYFEFLFALTHCNSIQLNNFKLVDAYSSSFSTA
jgi:hypothetical protein